MKGKKGTYSFYVRDDEAKLLVGSGGYESARPFSPMTAAIH
jgi:hypothetical protein